MKNISNIWYFDTLVDFEVDVTLVGELVVFEPVDVLLGVSVLVLWVVGEVMVVVVKELCVVDDEVTTLKWPFLAKKISVVFKPT